MTPDDKPYRYRVADDRFERLPASVRYPEVVTSSGWLGVSTPPSGAGVWTGGKTIKLPYPADFRKEPAPDTSVTSISEDGRILGGHSSAYGGENTAVQWRCH
jgi:hypothetical protein